MARVPLQAALGRLDKALARHSYAVQRSVSRDRRTALSIFRPIGNEHDKWPGWVRALRGRIGCYVIRDVASGSVLYVGSSASNLYDTLTRHFQRWGRQKKFWRGYRGGSSHDPGLVYSRARSEVAIELTEAGQQLHAEGELIRSLRPRDNLVERPEGAEVPF